MSLCPFQTLGFDLTGRVALVTGASRGLGAAMAQSLAEAGADLILWSRHLRLLEAQARRIVSFLSKPRTDHKHRSANIIVQRVDVTQTQTVRHAARAVLRRLGRIDILINNAGIWRGDAALSLSRRNWDEAVETDLTSVFFVSQAVVPAMIRQRYGKIINISSTSGFLAQPEGAVYGTVKAGLVHLTRILALEWGSYGIRVNGIAPGVFHTDMTQDMLANRTWVRRRLAELPLHRFGKPDEIGPLAVFLASSASDHITGQTILIDGGASLVR